MAGFTGKVVFKLSWALTMDRIAGLQDLQDRLFWRCCGLTMDRIEGFTGLWAVAQLGANKGQDGRITI